MPPIKTVLFDLDGTLADTAPDLAFALNEVLREQGRTVLPFATIRPVVSHGGVALIRLGFDMEPEEPGFEDLRQRLLEIYRDNIARETRLFDGMEQVLDSIEAHGMNWGVVTNKPSWLTEPLLDELGIHERAACVVSGDTLAERKPHPAPLLHACELCGSHAPECVYVGDAQRDIEAGSRADMHTLVALFGYIGAQDDPAAWRADAIIDKPAAILDWVTRHNNGN